MTPTTQQSHPEAERLSIGQIAQLSGVSEADLLGLIEYGVLTPNTPETDQQSFDISYVMKLQRAALMRQDLALDNHGFALTMMFLNQITGLESQLHSVQHELLNCRSLGAMDSRRGSGGGSFGATVKESYSCRTGDHIKPNHLGVMLITCGNGI
jgi:chaperone modulatory protein CbpM